MKKNILLLSIFLVVLVSLNPFQNKVQAALYDATGTWLIEIPEDELLMGLPVPAEDALVQITADPVADTFNLTGEPLTFTGIGDFVLSGSGVSSGTAYTFVPPLEQTLTSVFEVVFTMNDFELTSATTLGGQFDIFLASNGNFLGSINFAGALQPVPVPASIWLLGLALSCMWLFTKRKTPQLKAVKVKVRRKKQ